MTMGLRESSASADSATDDNWPPEQRDRLSVCRIDGRGHDGRHVGRRHYEDERVGITIGLGDVLREITQILAHPVWDIGH
jgi:hypothetical protein